MTTWVLVQFEHLELHLRKRFLAFTRVCENVILRCADGSAFVKGSESG